MNNDYEPITINFGDVKFMDDDNEQNKLLDFLASKSDNIHEYISILVKQINGLKWIYDYAKDTLEYAFLHGTTKATETLN